MVLYRAGSTRSLFYMFCSPFPLWSVPIFLCYKLVFGFLDFFLFPCSSNNYENRNRKMTNNIIMNIYTHTLILKSKNYAVIIFFCLFYQTRLFPTSPDSIVFYQFFRQSMVPFIFSLSQFFPEPKHGPSSLASHVSPAVRPTRLHTRSSNLCQPCALHHARALSALRPHHAAQPAQIPSPTNYACTESPGLSGPRRPHAPRAMENHPWPVHDYFGEDERLTSVSIHVVVDGFKDDMKVLTT